MGACGTCCSILVAIVMPPLGVCCKKGCGSQTCICLLLTIFIPYIGGLIYALCVICEDDHSHDVNVQVIVPQNNVYPQAAPVPQVTTVNIMAPPPQSSAYNPHFAPMSQTIPAGQHQYGQYGYAQPPVPQQYAMQPAQGQAPYPMHMQQPAQAPPMPMPAGFVASAPQPPPSYSELPPKF